MLVLNKECTLALYNSDFQLLKQDFETLYSHVDSLSALETSNEHIYLLSSYEKKILKLDFEFNIIKIEESLNFKPSGMCFYENHLYVCDPDNMGLKKFTGLIELENNFQLNYRPNKIKIINDVACIRTIDYDKESDCILFYSLKNFSLMNKYENHDGGVISLINNTFYEYKDVCKEICIFDTKGGIIAEIKTNLNENFFRWKAGIMVLNNDKLLISIDKEIYKFMLLE